MIADFLDGAPAGTERALQVLAIAESLTDPVAEQLYALAPVAGIGAAGFLRALRQASFIAPRNSEWSIDRRVRRSLLDAVAADDPRLAAAHRLLLSYTDAPDPAQAGDVVPHYLYTLGGRAYHQAGSGDRDAAVASYGDASLRSYDGAQWLASELAAAQERRGILPNDRTELLFLRAITLFREGKREDARPLLERIVAKNEMSRQTSIALNMLGNMVSRSDPVRAEELFCRGIAMAREIGNDERGVAINQHNLGVLIGRDSRRVDEARRLLEDSIAFGDATGNLHHAAQVRHSLGYMLNRLRYRDEAATAEQLLRQAIEDLIATADLSGAGQAMHTLALLVKRDETRQAEADQLYQRSIAIGEQTGDALGVAMRMRTWGQDLARRQTDPATAVKVLLRARELMLALRKAK